MINVLSYILLGLTIGVSLMTVYFTIGISILYILEGIFDRLHRKHHEAAVIGNYDKLAKLSDRMGTVATWIDRVETAILFV